MGTYGNLWKLRAWEFMGTYVNLWELMGTCGNFVRSYSVDTRQHSPHQSDTVTRSIRCNDADGIKSLIKHQTNEYDAGLLY